MASVEIYKFSKVKKHWVFVSSSIKGMRSYWPLHWFDIPVARCMTFIWQGSYNIIKYYIYIYIIYIYIYAYIHTISRSDKIWQEILKYVQKKTFHALKMDNKVISLTKE